GLVIAITAFPVTFNRAPKLLYARSTPHIVFYTIGALTPVALSRHLVKQSIT
mgnify:CR=1